MVFSGQGQACNGAEALELNFAVLAEGDLIPFLMS